MICLSCPYPIARSPNGPCSSAGETHVATGPTSVDSLPIGMLNTDSGAFRYQMLNILVVGIFSLISHNAVKTSPTRVRFTIAADDSSGSDNYHKG